MRTNREGRMAAMSSRQQRLYSLKVGKMILDIGESLIIMYNIHTAMQECKIIMGAVVF